MSSGTTAQTQPWKSKGQAEEAQYILQKDEIHLAAIRDQLKKDSADKVEGDTTAQAERNFEGGFGGQEDLEDRYATTSGEH